MPITEDEQDNGKIRCEAITQYGLGTNRQCRRNAFGEDIYCRQHRALKRRDYETRRDERREKRAEKPKPKKKTGIRCEALTDTYRKCRRQAHGSTRFCWQHNRALLPKSQQPKRKKRQTKPKEQQPRKLYICWEVDLDKLFEQLKEALEK